MSGERMSEDVYVRLREYLDRLPGGFPPESGGLDVEYLKRIFTPEEAEVELAVRPVPEPASAIARRCGKPPEETERILEGMVRKGLVLPVPPDKPAGKRLYMALQYMTGFGEQVLAFGLDEDSARLCLDYHLKSGFKAGFAGQRQMRVVPVGEAVESLPAVAPYDRIRDMVAAQEVIAVTPCPCRVSNRKAGVGCGHPVENELSFGFVAQWRIANGFGKRISTEEALRIMEEAERAGLLLAPTNTKEPVGMCMCAACCCHWLQGLRLHDRPADHVQSSYRARIDQDSCTACGSCIERCHMEAIAEVDGAMAVDEGRCIGCGLCVSACPEGAVVLVEREGAREPSDTYLGMFARVAGERGLPLGKMEKVMDRTPLPLFMGTWRVLHRLHLAGPVINLMEKRGLI